MATIVQGRLDGRNRSFAIVVSRFNETITSKLLGGALDMLERHGTEPGRITVVWVPGAFEIPLVARKMAATKDYAAVLCLGAVIRGSTPHFEHIAAQTARGIAHASVETGVPCLFGVLTCDTLDQALERSGTKGGNKGAQAALDALEMASLMEQL